MKKILPYILILSAISVSVCAAYYSIFGLSKLFSGEARAVILMASTLEFAKILLTVILHNYWNSFTTWLKSYFLLTVIILIVITSQGIYGFLTNAYQLTANRDAKVTKQVELIEFKKKIFLEQKNELIKEKGGIITNIESLRNSLGSNILQSVDKKTGQLIKTTSNENRRAYETQLNEAINRRDKLSNDINVLSDSISNSELKIIDIQNNSDVASELGPLKYLSNLTGKSMDTIVNWFLILLILVFDPLAIAMILGASSIFKHNQPNNKEIQIKSDIVRSKSDDKNIELINEITEPIKDSAHLDDFIEKHHLNNDEPEIVYEPFDETEPSIKKKKY